MKISRVILTKFLCLLLLAFVGAELHGQIKLVRPIDIADGIRKGRIHLTVAPPSVIDTLKAFDGNFLTEAIVPKSDTLVITLQFDTVVQIQKSRVFFWNSGKWSLECASSISDLETKSASYALLVDSSAFSPFMWDSASFPGRKAQFIRLKARNPVDSSMYLGEWILERTFTFTSLLILPQPLRILPGASLQLSVKMLDDENNLYPYFIGEPLNWYSSNTSVATVDADGKLTGVSVGSAEITTSTDARTISGKTTVDVVADFRPQKAQQLKVKVALVIQDPVVLQTTNRIHEEFGWRDPRALANRLVYHFREASDSVVEFQFVQTIDASMLFTRLYGSFMTVSRYYELLKEPGWKTLRAASDSGRLWFDYRAFVKYYHFDEKRNNGEIDEVWVFAGPYIGMYESQLMGPNAFWWNSPPIKDGTALKKLLSVMGLNYERGVDQAFHSFGHRFESAITQAYFIAQGRTWNPKSLNPTPWDLFTRIDKDMPDQAHVGNIHFPPNGVRDYDYGNTRFVKSYAENWIRYPYLFDFSSQVNVSTWYYRSGEPLAEGLDHLGYLRWWYNHLPKFVGVTDGVLNNWWHYAVDFEGAVELAKQLSIVRVDNDLSNSSPFVATLEQNYPNPFNLTTNIEFRIAQTGFVSLKIYDVLGREVATLVNGNLNPGKHTVTWNVTNVSSGVYLYRLSASSGAGGAGNFSETKKLVILK